MNPHSNSASRIAAGLPWLAAVSLASLLAACNHDNSTTTSAVSASSSTPNSSNAAYTTSSVTGSEIGATSATGLGSSNTPVDYNSGSSTTSASSASGTGTRSEHRFWKKAKLASQREYAYSQLAVAQASDAQVRSFAQQIVSDHQRMSQDFRSTTGRDMTMDNDADVNSASTDMNTLSTATANHTGAATGDSSMAALPSSGMSSSAGGTTYNPDAAARKDRIAADAAQNGTSADNAHTSDAYPNGVPSMAGTSDHTGPATGDPAMAALPGSGMSTSASGTTYNPDAASRKDQIASDASRNGTSADNPRTTDAYPNGAPVTGSSGSMSTGSSGSMTTGNGMTDDRTHMWGRDDWMKKDHAYSRLAGKTGADFDRAYLDLIIDQEKTAVSLYEKTGKMRDNSDSNVQTFAGTHLSTHQQRLDQAKTLRRNLS